jgi:type IV pilus assembly protein PilO
MLSGKRAPLIAGIAAVAIAVLLIVILILPKLSQISDAKKTLDAARTMQGNLESQRAALIDAKNAAPAAQNTINKVNRLIPPTADLPGLILLLRNAADTAGVTYVTITPSTPTLDSTTGISTISVTVVSNGSYAALTDYLYGIETLPRAAKILTTSIAAGAVSSSSATQLTMTTTLDVYTADTSSGPGSSPGPQTGPVASPGA